VTKYHQKRSVCCKAADSSSCHAIADLRLWLSLSDGVTLEQAGSPSWVIRLMRANALAQSRKQAN